MRLSSSTVTTIALWHSPKSNSSLLNFLVKLILAPKPFVLAINDSEIQTARPPSDRSWADFIIPLFIASKVTLCTFDSYSKSSEGIGPSILLCIICNW